VGRAVSNWPFIVRDLDGVDLHSTSTTRRRDYYSSHPVYRVYSVDLLISELSLSLLSPRMDLEIACCSEDTGSFELREQLKDAP
jgi:hypothetical protein